jgi:hypothetical protein
MTFDPSLLEIIYTVISAIGDTTTSMTICNTEEAVPEHTVNCN